MFKIIGINILVFIAYVGLIIFNSTSTDKGFNIAIGMGVCLCVQVLVNGIAGVVCLVLGQANWGRWLLISAAVLMPLGFCSWLILLSIFG